MKKLTQVLLIGAVVVLIAASVFPASYGDVVINELMWMGSTSSTADEWIELRNMTGFSIDLSNWDITRYNGTNEVLMLTIAPGNTISAGGYFLISNYNAAGSQINVTPDIVTTAVLLDNNGLQIKIYDGAWESGGILIDTADDGSGAPAAGDNVNKYSMVRGPTPGNYTPGDGTLPSNWHTADRAYGWDSGATERGTPANDSSLPVTVTSFSAEISNGKVILRWFTESEMETLGFHILRAEEEAGPFVRITTALIPCQGNGSGGSQYNFTDRNVEAEKGYWYQISEVCASGNSHIWGPVCAISGAGSFVPEACRLFSNYPNPFNPSTKIGYEISGEDGSIPAVLIVYNLCGQEIRTLVNNIEEAGSHSVVWDGRNSDGLDVPCGIYFYQLKVGDEFVEMKKMVKVK